MSMEVMTIGGDLWGVALIDLWRYLSLFELGIR